MVNEVFILVMLLNLYHSLLPPFSSCLLKHSSWLVTFKGSYWTTIAQVELDSARDWYSVVESMRITLLDSHDNTFYSNGAKIPLQLPNS